MDFWACTLQNWRCTIFEQRLPVGNTGLLCRSALSGTTRPVSTCSQAALPNKSNAGAPIETTACKHFRGPEGPTAANAETSCSAASGYCSRPKSECRGTSHEIRTPRCRGAMWQELQKTAGEAVSPSDNHGFQASLVHLGDCSKNAFKKHLRLALLGPQQDRPQLPNRI